MSGYNQTVSGLIDFKIPLSSISIVLTDIFGEMFYFTILLFTRFPNIVM